MKGLAVSVSLALLLRTSRDITFGKCRPLEFRALKRLIRKAYPFHGRAPVGPRSAGYARRLTTSNTTPRILTPQCGANLKQTPPVLQKKQLKPF